MALHYPWSDSVQQVLDVWECDACHCKCIDYIRSRGLTAAADLCSSTEDWCSVLYRSLFARWGACGFLYWEPGEFMAWIFKWCRPTSGQLHSLSHRYHELETWQFRERDSTARGIPRSHLSWGAWFIHSFHEECVLCYRFSQLRWMNGWNVWYGIWGFLSSVSLFFLAVLCKNSCAWSSDLDSVM